MSEQHRDGGRFARDHHHSRYTVSVHVGRQPGENIEIIDARQAAVPIRVRVPFAYVLELVECTLTCQCELLLEPSGSTDVQRPTLLAVERGWDRIDDID